MSMEVTLQSMLKGEVTASGTVETANNNSSSINTTGALSGRTVASAKDVEGSKPEAPSALKEIKTSHIIRIFLDDNETIEVSDEQLQRIRKMHESIEENVQFSFNYNTLIICASIIAGLGLVSNGIVNIIASMLISPLMGPVIGIAYGTTIHDWKLVRLSIRNEIISLFVCIVMGFIIGAITGPTTLSKSWPTSEMEGRGQWGNLLVGLPVAFFSGLGVAVSILDEQTSSLVGVAISASLLPPAVNAGIMWIAYAFTKRHNVLHSCATPSCYKFDSGEYAYRGFVSLLLTIANVVLIWISSILMFRSKDALPIKKKIFWEDLGTARKIYCNQALLRSDNFEASRPFGLGDSMSP